jgi:hypothetical protein
VLGPRFHGIAHLLSEPAHGERHALAFDEPVVEPGRARRRHLAIEVDVRPVGENVRTTEPAHLDAMPPAGGASAKASIPRKRTWWSHSLMRTPEFRAIPVVTQEAPMLEP